MTEWGASKQGKLALVNAAVVEARISLRNFRTETAALRLYQESRQPFLESTTAEDLNQHLFHLVNAAALFDVAKTQIQELEAK